MNCTACNQVVEPIHIGTSDYCPNCGNRIVEPHPTPVKKAGGASASARSMDIRPGRPAAKSAPDLHSRPTAAAERVLDLRNASPGRHTSLLAARSDLLGDLSQSAPMVRAHHAATGEHTTATRQRHFRRFEDRFKQAKGVARSENISKYSPLSGATNPGIFETVVVVNEAASQEPVHHAHIPPLTEARKMPSAAATHAETLQKLFQAKQEHAHTHSGPKPWIQGSGRAMAAVTAIVIMGSYIWLQNYPKLAIQSAGQRAGLAAELPTYIPSSYHLSRTDTAPGLVTLNFTSPSNEGALKIAQQKTNWDSNSLLDNFVAPQSPDYSTIEGQGLTIYLYGQNQAAWVNRGIRYTIEGASRLSREQILKIAYSL